MGSVGFSDVTDKELKVGLEYSANNPKYGEALDADLLRNIANGGGVRSIGQTRQLPNFVKAVARELLLERNRREQDRYNAYVAAAMKMFNYRRNEIKKATAIAQMPSPQETSAPPSTVKGPEKVWPVDKKGRPIFI